MVVLHGTMNALESNVIFSEIITMSDLNDDNDFEDVFGDF